MMADKRAYNPLSVDELGQNAVRALMGYQAASLPPPVSFDGAGVYTIHYSGSFDAYRDMSEPIYVGKAEPPGKRQGRSSAKQVGPVLHRRLVEHSVSIEHVKNLDPVDFQCRWLVLDPVWIGLTEQCLISEYRPLWNVVVDGFGNHDPGSGRRNQRRSQWDTLHPGREWAAHLRDRKESAEEILGEVMGIRAPTPAARRLSRGSNWGLCLRRLKHEVVVRGADEAV